MEAALSRSTFWFTIFLALMLTAALGWMAPVSDSAGAGYVAQVAPADDAWRAALPRDPEQAAQAYLARLPAAIRARSDAYFEGGYRLDAMALAAGMLFTWMLLASRLLVGMRDALERRRGPAWWHAAAVVAVFLLVMAVWAMPLDAYRDFYREHAYGLANQSFGAWFGEQLLHGVLGLLGGGLFLFLIAVVLRRAPRTWWIWGSGLGIVLFAILLVIGPLFIQPLFNTYKPLADPRVKEPILAMARANGVPVDDVYQVDASRQTNRISANVAGAFGVAAIRLNDNLLNRTSLPEIEAVMGHELGHYVLNHIYKHLLVFALVMICGFRFLRWAYAQAIGRWGARYGIRGEDDPAGLPVLVALFSLYMYAAAPVVNTQIRVAEEEADLFGLNASRQPDGFAEVNLKLIEYRKADPGPVEELLFFDHPSPKKRIVAAMRWKAEQLKK
jgi:STE24 endopeptidase